LQNVSDYHVVELLISIIGGLIIIIQFIIAFVVNGFKNNVNELWKKYNLLSDSHNQLKGEHEIMCRGKHGR